jgi:DNA-binding response OmpR family regulator
VVDEVRVVVVDDANESAEGLASYLDLNGYATRIANDGTAALAIAQTFVPHCVLLDVNMPGMDGLELARRLRQQFVDDVVLIAITGAAPSDTIVKATFGLVDHYLQKPIDFAELDKILPPL